MAENIPVVSLLMETAPPEALISAVEPPSRSHLGHSGGSPVLPAVKSPKTGHATMGAASEDELRVIPAKQFKSGDNIYPMGHSSRGKCIIFNNDDFGGLAHKRVGSELDVRRMKYLFRAFNFDCIEHWDLTASEMKGELLELAQSEEHKNADCLVIFLMSHGHRGLIFGSDMEKVYLNNDVFSLFNNDNCPVLQGKPKLFFVQACRGRKNDIGTTNVAHDTSDAGLIEPEEPQSFTKLERVSTWSDTYIAYSTMYNYESLKNHVIGSWFLSAVYEVFSEHAGTMHLENLMHYVQDKVLNKSSYDGGKQTCSVVLEGWRKKLYFNPGLSGTCSQE